VSRNDAQALLEIPLASGTDSINASGMWPLISRGSRAFFREFPFMIISVREVFPGKLETTRSSCR
jgi:hypothetical protein